MDILELIRWNLVVPQIHATDKSAALRELIDFMVDSNAISPGHRKEIEAATFLREEVFPTSIGCGVAFPHGPVSCLTDEIAVLGLSRTGIEFGGHNNHGCQIVLLTLTPIERGSRYIELIKHLAHVFNQPAFCEALPYAKSVDEAVEMIEMRLLEL